MTESVHLKLYNEKRIQEGGITNLFNLILNQLTIDSKEENRDGTEQYQKRL